MRQTTAVVRYKRIWPTTLSPQRVVLAPHSHLYLVRPTTGPAASFLPSFRYTTVSSYPHNGPLCHCLFCCRCCSRRDFCRSCGEAIHPSGKGTCHLPHLQRPICSQYFSQGTWYDTGLGACGWNNVNSDAVIALSPSVYSGGSHCGQVRDLTSHLFPSDLLTSLILDRYRHQRRHWCEGYWHNRGRVPGLWP